MTGYDRASGVVQFKLAKLNYLAKTPTSEVRVANVVCLSYSVEFHLRSNFTTYHASCWLRSDFSRSFKLRSSYVDMRACINARARILLIIRVSPSDARVCFSEASRFFIFFSKAKALRCNCQLDKDSKFSFSYLLHDIDSRIRIYAGEFKYVRLLYTQCVGVKCSQWILLYTKCPLLIASCRFTNSAMLHVNSQSAATDISLR